MPLIKLTLQNFCEDINQSPIYIYPQHIAQLQRGSTSLHTVEAEKGTPIHFTYIGMATGPSLRVKETPEEILRKVQRAEREPHS
jgi:hypothetical protein